MNGSWNLEWTIVIWTDELNAQQMYSLVIAQTTASWSCEMKTGLFLQLVAIKNSKKRLEIT